jgi:hypothetical protein
VEHDGKYVGCLKFDSEEQADWFLNRLNDKMFGTRVAEIEKKSRVELLKAPDSIPEKGVLRYMRIMNNTPVNMLNTIPVTLRKGTICDS